MAYQRHRNAGWNLTIQIISCVPLLPVDNTIADLKIVYHSIPELSWNLSSSSHSRQSTWPMLHSPSSLRNSIRSIHQRVYMLWFWSRYVHLCSHPGRNRDNDCLFKVERGFSAHRNGAFVAPPPFNQGNCWKPLGDFIGNINKVKEERWASILRIQGPDEDKTDVDSDTLGDTRANESMISAFRADMYIPSSPLNGWFQTFSMSYITFFWSYYALILPFVTTSISYLIIPSQAWADI